MALPKLRLSVGSLSLCIEISSWCCSLCWSSDIHGILVVADHLCTMTVIDMSYNSPGLRVLYFAPSDLMPRVNKLGDIIRFHRIEVCQLLVNRFILGFTSSTQCKIAAGSGFCFCLLSFFPCANLFHVVIYALV